MNKSTRLFNYRQPGRFFGTLLLTAAALLTGGCGGGEDTTTGYVSSPGSEPVAIRVNSASEITQISDANYDNNVNGLVTGATLQNWIDDWQNNRPAGITGRLIILQINNGPAGTQYITPKPDQGVLTYSIISDTGPNSRLVMSRSNGVTTTRAMVLDGASMDRFLREYGINPRQDMIVFAMGTGGAFANMQMGRGWYLFRYWGVEATHLAVLNGGASNAAVMNQTYLSDTVNCDENVDTTCLPNSGWISVKNLPDDNTILQATLEDVMDVVDGRTNAFIWDARSANEYAAIQNVKQDGSGNNTTYLGIDFRNGGSKQGHPLGAVNLSFQNLLITSDGSFRYKDKTAIQAYLDGQQVDGAEFLYYDAGAVIPVGQGNAYQSGQTIITYCETTYRAMITGIASAVILGLPVRFYDGAMVEWNTLASIQDQNSQFILPADSPWRTDTLARSVFTYNTQTAIAPRQIDDPYAVHANKIILADKAYKRGETPAGGGGGGGSVLLPPNPCGG